MSFGGLTLIVRWFKSVEITLTTMPETICIPKEEYLKLKKMQKVDQELLHDIASGIRDILEGKVKEV